MKIRIYIFAFIFTVFFVDSASADPDGGPSVSREYRIKAAFLYNFLKVVDWPKDTAKDPNESFVIGIVGKDPFSTTFEPLKEKTVKGKKIAIKQFEGFGPRDKNNNETKSKEHIEDLRKCHLLFVCSSEKTNIKKIIKLVNGYSILTVGETDGFLEAGGIINFIPTAKKGEFEINLTAGKKTRLSFSSKLIKIAKRVIKEELSEKDKS